MAWEFVGIKMPLALRKDLEGLAQREASTLSGVIRRLIEREAQRPLSGDEPNSMHDGD